MADKYKDNQYFHLDIDGTMATQIILNTLYRNKIIFLFSVIIYVYINLPNHLIYRSKLLSNFVRRFAHSPSCGNQRVIRNHF